MTVWAYYAAAVALAIVGCFFAIRGRKAPAASNKPAGKKAARQERRPDDAVVDGAVRQCKFCEVVVTEAQTLAQLWQEAQKVRWKRPTAMGGRAGRGAGRASVAAPPVTQTGTGLRAAPRRRQPDALGGGRRASLPTLGFALVDGVEPILPLIRSGQGLSPTARPRLSDGSVLDGCQVGDRFGEPLAARLRTAVLEVTGIDTGRAAGRRWCEPLGSAADAQRF